MTSAPSAAEYEEYLTGATAPTVRAFVEAVVSRVVVTPTFVDGLRCARVLEVAMQSNEQRCWVRVPWPEE